jgi:hypothetical protein
MLWIFIALKNPSPQPGFNPWTTSSMASMLTIIPPRQHLHPVCTAECHYIHFMFILTIHLRYICTYHHHHHHHHHILLLKTKWIKRLRKDVTGCLLPVSVNTTIHHQYHLSKSVFHYLCSAELWGSAIKSVQWMTNPHTLKYLKTLCQTLVFVLLIHTKPQKHEWYSESLMWMRSSTAPI